MYIEAAETREINGSKVAKRVSCTKLKNIFPKKIKINKTHATNIKRYD